MEKKFTKGPWSISYTGDGKEALINRGDVARVNADEMEEGEYNAKLIVAAPDLLEALEIMVTMHAERKDGNILPIDMQPNHIQMAMKYIKKALE
jgi:hypothetical protein